MIGALGLVGFALLAQSPLAQSYTITQVHIAYGQNASTKVACLISSPLFEAFTLCDSCQMSVAWMSESNETMTVTYGKSKDALTMESPPATVNRYTIDNNYWGPSFNYTIFPNYTSNWCGSLTPVRFMT